MSYLCDLEFVASSHVIWNALLIKKLEKDEKYILAVILTLKANHLKSFYSLNVDIITSVV